MGAVTEKIGKISVVTDHDCGNYRIGEIYENPEVMVVEHISRYGEYGFEQMRDYAIQMLASADHCIKQQRAYSVSGQCSASTGGL